MTECEGCPSLPSTTRMLPSSCRHLHVTGFGYIGVRDGIIEQVSIRTRELLGYTVTEMVGKEIAAFFWDPLDWPKLLEQVKNAREGCFRGRVLTVRHKRNHRVFLEASVHIETEAEGTYYLDLLFNIKGMSKRSFFGLLDDTANVYYQADLDDTVVFATPAEARLLGFNSVDELIGTNRSTYYEDPEERSHFLRRLQDDFARTGRGRVEDHECHFLNRKTKETFSVITTSQYILDNDNKPIGVEGIYREATLETFIGYVAHGLRSPISVMFLALDQLREKANANEPIEDAIGTLFNQVKRLCRHVDRLNKLRLVETRKYEAKPETVDVLKILRDCWIELEPTAKERKIKIDIQSELRQTQSRMPFYDPELLRLVVMNLLENAIKYSFRDATIKVFSEMHDEGWVLCFGNLWYPVTPADQANMYRKFWRSQRAKDTDDTGTGIGLYLIKRILDEYGGSIKMRSRPVPGAPPHVWTNTFELIIETRLNSSKTERQL